MKARTYFRNKENIYELMFHYEDYYGGAKFKNYDDMVANGEMPNTETKGGYLVCTLHSFEWGCCERLDMLELKRKPTAKIVRGFINDCKEFCSNHETISRKVAMEEKYNWCK